jgi:hypothetical protein
MSNALLRGNHSCFTVLAFGLAGQYVTSNYLSITFCKVDILKPYACTVVHLRRRKKHRSVLLVNLLLMPLSYCLAFVKKIAAAWCCLIPELFRILLGGRATNSSVILIYDLDAVSSCSVEYWKFVAVLGTVSALFHFLQLKNEIVGNKRPTFEHLKVRHAGLDLLALTLLLWYSCKSFTSCLWNCMISLCYSQLLI